MFVIPNGIDTERFSLLFPMNISRFDELGIRETDVVVGLVTVLIR
jgi:hypothetical protein